MLFDLINKSVIFQYYINSILFNCLNKFVIIFVNDFLIYSVNQQKHELYIKIVLKRFCKAKLQTSLNKSEFHVN